MISEGSRDTEDWSNDAENSDLHHKNKVWFKILLNTKLYFNVSQYYCFYCIFDQINSVLVSITDFFKTH